MLSWIILRPLVVSWFSLFTSNRPIVTHCITGLETHANVIQFGSQRLHAVKSEVTVVGLRSLLDDKATSRLSRVPASSHSVYHLQRFSSDSNLGISYPEFCSVEERLATIVFAYSQDTKHRWCIIVPPEFLYSDSLRSFGTPSLIRKIIWVTPSTEIGVPDVVAINIDVSDQGDI